MKWVVLDKFGKNIAVFKHFTLNYVFIFAMNFNEREFRKNFLIFNLITYGEFYQFNLSSCIRQQNSLTAQFVSFSLSNLANIFYPPQFLQ